MSAYRSPATLPGYNRGGGSERSDDAVNQNSEIISRVMDKAQRADRQALFAGLQVAVVALVDIKHGSPFTVDEAFAQIERALDDGKPYGATRAPDRSPLT